MVVTNDEAISWEARSFRDHGYDVKERMGLLEMEQALSYIHRRVGFNYRMTEVQSSIGLKELERIDSWNLPRRRRYGQILIDALSNCPQIAYLPVNTQEKVNGFYVFPLVLNLEALTCDKRQFLQAVLAEGVVAWKEFWPQSYQERAYTDHNGFGRTKFPFESSEYTDSSQVDYRRVFCPNCAWLEDRTFIVHLFPTFEEAHIRLMAEAIKKVASHYAR